MKQILITLLTFFTLANIATAQLKLEITPSDNKYAKMSIDCEDQSKCDEKLIKWIDKQKFFKGEWSDNQADSIVSKIESDLSGESITKYFKPSNFSVNLVDKSAEIAEQALDKAIADKLVCGEKAVKFIAKNNVKKSLAKSQIKTMVNTYAEIFNLLKAGAIDTAIEEINSKSPDGTIVTAQDKTDIVAFLNSCK